jgi:HTH-type transcriptional regulator/antitoxin HipB
MVFLFTNGDMCSLSPYIDFRSRWFLVRVNSTGGLAAAVRGRRKDLGLSQAELAALVGVSRAWIIEVEAGKPTLEFGLVLRLLDGLGLRIDVVIDDVRDDGANNRTDLDSLLDEYRDR